MPRIAAIVATIVSTLVAAVTIPTVIYLAKNSKKSNDSSPTKITDSKDDLLSPRITDNTDKKNDLIKGVDPKNKKSDECDDIIRIEDIESELKKYKSPINFLNIKAGGKSYHDPKLAKVFKETYAISQTIPINAVSSCHIYSSPNCKNKIAGDIPIKWTTSKGTKEGNIYLNAGRSIGGIYDTIPRAYQGKTAVLDFADYYEAGGGVMHGSKPQEECLCRVTNLPAFLWEEKTHKDLFAVNLWLRKEGKLGNKGGYADDRLMHIEGVTCITKDTDNYEIVPGNQRRKIDVIWLAAPDLRYVSYSPAVREMLKSRIRAACEIARIYHVETFGVGAVGCGVFRWDPEVVANIFKEVLVDEGYRKHFTNVVINIPNKHSQNYLAFSNKFTPFLHKKG